MVRRRKQSVVRRRSCLISDDVGPILGGEPLSLGQMARMCELITKFTGMKVYCLDSLPAKWKVKQQRHAFLLLDNHTRWICCYNDGKTEISQYNTNESTDTTAITTRLLEAYNLQPFELTKAIVRSDVPSSSSDVDSGYVAIAVSAQLASNIPPTELDPTAIRRNVVRVLYWGKLNGFPDYVEATSCWKTVVKPEEVLFRNLFDAYEKLNSFADPPIDSYNWKEEIVKPVSQSVMSPGRVVPISSQEDTSSTEEESVPNRKKMVVAQHPEPLIEFPDPDKESQRVMAYEAGPFASKVSRATEGILDRNNIKYVQYERITKEIHYVRPKPDKSNE
ncbi:uncharacterized protein LOC135938464 [Cloeon dipterum]|uniref:uncharacterized protein LOC135938464 n=1 Tax=Cloeon dipterum TaxID=197152 RepID=UPI00321FD338